MAYHSFLSRYLEEFCNIHESDTFNVNRPSLLVRHVIAMRVNFLDAFTFGELVSLDDILDFVFCPPFHAVLEHYLHVCENEFPSATES